MTDKCKKLLQHIHTSPLAHKHEIIYNLWAGGEVRQRPRGGRRPSGETLDESDEHDGRGAHS